MTYYYVRTNGYDCVVVDDWEQRHVKVESNEYNFNIGYAEEFADEKDRERKARHVLIELSTWFTPDETYWEQYDESVEELTDGAEIVATYEVNDSDNSERTFREAGGKAYAISKVYVDWDCSHEAVRSADGTVTLDDCDECWCERFVYVNNDTLCCAPGGDIYVQQPSKWAERPEFDGSEDFLSILGDDIYNQLTSPETPELDAHHKKLVADFSK